MANSFSADGNEASGKDKIHGKNGLFSVKQACTALLVLAILYGVLFVAARRAIYTMNITPLPQNASLDKISEGRIMKHIWHLAGEIGIRQEGSSGLIKAAEYLKAELMTYKKRSSTNLRVDIDETFVNGSFNMIFLRHSISLAYRNHTNIVMRISAADADDNATSVLVNGHFDSPLGSPGAGDCASCVASMLEVVRFIIDTDWVPPSPIIFLFNGAEELFMVASHGFMTTHKWRLSIGASINIESSGTGGPDLVCQSGPGSWPVQVYAEAAVYPTANTAAQDIFHYIPGDTDYRMFSEDFGDIPGLDIILVLESYFYHTAYDTPEKIVAGSMQSRGENLFSLLEAFARSPELKNSQERAQMKKSQGGVQEKRLIFFDFMGWFMVYYSHEMAMALHLLPLGVVLLFPSITSTEVSGLQHVSERIHSIVRGAISYALGLFLAIMFPVLVAVLRLLPSSTAMTWFAQPWIAFFMFAPASLVGLLLPRVVLGKSLLEQQTAVDKEGKLKQLDWECQWGAIAYYASSAAVGTYFGIGDAFLSFMWAMFIMLAFAIYQKCCCSFGRHSLLSLLGYSLPLTIPALYSLYFGGVFWQVVLEKMGMAGSIPPPFGFFMADVIVAAITGLIFGWCVGPVLPVAGSWLASGHLIHLLIWISIGSSAVSSHLFPYSTAAPKRVVLQHTFQTAGHNHILNSSYDIAVIDANPLSFLFKSVPLAAQKLNIDPSFKESTALKSPKDTWLALYPIQYIFCESFKFQADSSEVLKNHPSVPHLSLEKLEQQERSNTRRLYLELDLGSLQEIWAAVVNVTGPLLSWSLSDQKLPVPETVDGGPRSYICRLSGRNVHENWKFWLEANSSDVLKVDLAVLDQQMELDTQRFIELFPPWVSVTAGSSYLSSYSF